MATGHSKSKVCCWFERSFKTMETVISNFLHYTDQKFMFHLTRELLVLNFPQLYNQCKNQEACLNNLYDALFNIFFLGHAMTQAASHQPLTMEAWV
jgi:hypothetical protein